MADGILSPTTLPHSGAALFVSEVLEVQETWIRCSGLVDPTSPYAVAEWCESYVALELGAQAAALLEAHTARGEADGRLGYLVRIRSIELEVARFAAGEALVATAKRVAAMQPLHMYEIEVQNSTGERILSGTISTYDLGAPE